MTDAPDFPARQLWAKARTGPIADLVSGRAPLLRQGEPVAVLGGKLASALLPALEAAGYPAAVAQRRHPVLADLPPEDPEYEAFGHGYGEVHTAREFRQLVERAARIFAPAEDRWNHDGRVVDPFRPGLRYAATTDQEFDVLQERHLNTLRTTFRRAGTLIVSLSQSEIWESRADGAVFPRWTVAAETHFDPEKHAVRTLTVEETILDLLAAIRTLRTLNPAMTIVLMVSPEPQLATTHPAHVLVAGTVGKAILRIAVEAVSGTEGVAYFPALEIATLTSPTSACEVDGSMPDQLTKAIAEALISVGESANSTDVQDAVPITVLRTLPAEPKPKRRKPIEPVTEASEPSSVPAAAASAPGPKPKPKPKPKSSMISVVDPYSQAKAQEAEAKAARRAAHYASLGQVPPPEEEPAKPTMSPAERQVMRREKALARETRPAAEAENSAGQGGPAPATPEPRPSTDPIEPRRKAGKTPGAATAVPPAAADESAKKMLRKMKRQAKASDQAAEERRPEADAAIKARRERKQRAAKG